MAPISILGFVDRIADRVDCCPWATVAAAGVGHCTIPQQMRRPSIYSPEERQRRDASHWTSVQGVLAPGQFAVFLVSLWLVLRYLATGEGLTIATASIVVKTLVLYAIMVTGSIWEREVFGRYLFARAFFWEDLVSIIVLSLHTGYLIALFTHSLPVREQMLLALCAYAAYVVNATQFVIKLRAARRQGEAYLGEPALAPRRPR